MMGMCCLCGLNSISNFLGVNFAIDSWQGGLSPNAHVPLCTLRLGVGLAKFTHKISRLMVEIADEMMAHCLNDKRRDAIIEFQREVVLMSN